VLKAITDSVGVVSASGTSGARASGGSGVAGEVLASTAAGVRRASADTVGIVSAGGAVGGRFVIAMVIRQESLDVGDLIGEGAGGHGLSIYSKGATRVEVDG
jgi:hypothetical protein